MQGSVSSAIDASPCSLQQDIDTAALPVIDALPVLPFLKSNWSPIVRPFSLLPAYLVAGSPNHTAHAALSLTNAEGNARSVQLVTNCYNETRWVRLHTGTATGTLVLVSAVACSSWVAFMMATESAIHNSSVLHYFWQLCCLLIW